MISCSSSIRCRVARQIGFRKLDLRNGGREMGDRRLILSVRTYRNVVLSMDVVKRACWEDTTRRCRTVVVDCVHVYVRV